MLRINGLKVVRGDFTVSLPELSVADGQCVALCGVSGSGKSTLMEAIALLTPPLEVSNFVIDGVAVDELCPKGRQALRISSIGIMPQTGGLIPYLTVRENLELQIRMALRQQITPVFNSLNVNASAKKEVRKAVDAVSATSINSGDAHTECESTLDPTESDTVQLAAAQLSLPIDSYDSQAARQLKPKSKRKASAESLLRAEMISEDMTTCNLEISNQESNTKVKEMMQILNPYIDIMKLGEQLDKLPEQLSIGQRQRALFLRAIAHKPRLLLIDEPTSALDPENAANLFTIIDEIAHSSGISVLLITHDLKAASRYTRYVYDDNRSYSDHSVFTHKDDSYFDEDESAQFYAGRAIDSPSAPHIYNPVNGTLNNNTFGTSVTLNQKNSAIDSDPLHLSHMHSTSFSRIGGFTNAINYEAGSVEFKNAIPEGVDVSYDEQGHIYTSLGRITYYTTPVDKLKHSHQDDIDEQALTSSKRGGFSRNVPVNGCSSKVDASDDLSTARDASSVDADGTQSSRAYSLLSREGNSSSSTFRDQG